MKGLSLSFLLAFIPISFWGVNSTTFTGNYYVAAAGSDGNNGMSIATPFHTIAKINSLALSPKNIVNFNGGDTFTGPLVIQSGTAGSNITFQSYGAGLAVITNSTGTAIGGTNVSFFTLCNLMAEAPTNYTFGTNAIDIRTSTSSGALYDGWNVSNCVAVGGCIGIYELSMGTDCTTNSKIVGNTISNSIAFGTWMSDTAQTTGITHLKPYIALNKVFNIPGCDTSAIGHGGSAICIVMGCSADGIIESNTAWHYGMQANTGGFGGPGGIFPISSIRCTMRYNEAYDVVGLLDALTFDLDLTCTNCSALYNYGHDADGAGFICLNNNGNVAAFNVFLNVARKIDCGVMLYDGCTFYNNTVSSPARAAIATLDGNSKVYNNLFLTRADNVVIFTNSTVAQGNAYCSYGNLHLVYGGSSYTDLPTFRTGTSQENQGGTARGFVGDPNLVAPFVTVGLGNTALIPGLTNAAPSIGSYMDQAGLNLNSLFSITTGGVDIRGNALRSPYSIGAIDGTNSYPKPIPDVFEYKSTGLTVTSSGFLNNAVYGAGFALFGQNTTVLDPSPPYSAPNGAGASWQTNNGYWKIFFNSSLSQAAGTISFWFNTAGAGASSNFMLFDSANSSSLNGLYVYLSGSSHNLVVDANNGSTVVAQVVASGVYNDGNWHNVIVNFTQGSGGALRMWVDGALAGAANNSASWTFGSNPFYFGHSDNSFWQGYAGYMADMYFLSRTNTPAELPQIASASNTQ